MVAPVEEKGLGLVERERGGLGREGKGCEENALFGSNSLFNWLCASHMTKESYQFFHCA